MKIEEFKMQDVQEVLKLHADVSDGWGIKGLINDAQNSHTKSFIVRNGSGVIAYISYLNIEDAELVFVCVDKNHRRKGVAEFLIKETIKIINPPLVVLEVRSQNTAAIDLYKKLGFNQIGVRKNFYSFPDDDALVLELILKEKNT